MAGGSQIIISKNGITIKTPNDFKVFARQHQFKTGSRVKAEIPTLPILKEETLFSNKWDFYDLFYQTDFSNVKYKLINNKNNTYVSGTLDQHGRTQRLSSDHNDDYDILIGTEEDWTVSVDDGLDDEDAFEYLCRSHDQHDQEV
jgi:type VI secretion system secreted protein VgrG